MSTNNTKRTTTTTAVSIDHVSRILAGNYESNTNNFERLLGRFDASVVFALREKNDQEGMYKALESMQGELGFMIFEIRDVGKTLRVRGITTVQAKQYLFGNPLFATSMTKHDVRAGLYAPLRMIIYVNDKGETVAEYDTPSSLFGQFHNREIQEFADQITNKLERLLSVVEGSIQ